MKKIILSVISFIILMFTFTSCFDDLNTKPLDETLFTGDQAYENEEAYLQSMAKLYACFILPGNNGPATSEIADIDAGTGMFLRVWWYAQEYTTDEAKWIHIDDGFPEINHNTLTATNAITTGLYYRICFMITLFNDYLKQTTEDIVRDRGHGAQWANIRQYRAEARLLRALTYYYFMDLYGNVPFITEKDPIGSFIPPQISRKNLYEYVEKELLDLENDPDLAGPKANQYGRVDKAVVWMTLSRLYLNSEVYLNTVDPNTGNILAKGEKKYDKAKLYAEKIINAGYELSDRYGELFMANNGRNPNARKEIIFSFRSNALYSPSYLTYHLVAGSRAGRPGENDPSSRKTSGTANSNAGMRVTMAFLKNTFWEDIDMFFDNENKVKDPVTTPYVWASGDPLGFSRPAIAGTLGEYVYDTDNRAIFFTRMSELPMATNYTRESTKYGWLPYKWSNITKDLRFPSYIDAITGEEVFRDENADPPQFQDIDFPLMRLAEAYLNYAEATVRMSGGSSTDARSLQLLNDLRDRAGVTKGGRAHLTSFDLEYIFKERGREFYLEGFRRTDLIRWDRFTGTDYQWEFKGSLNGHNPTPLNVAEFRCLFPIPQNDLATNPKLKQNPGYEKSH